jgi:hypothetical protein
MAKDRFSRHKPINWSKGFKETGSMIRPYKSEIEIKEVKYKTREQHHTLLDVKNNYYEFMSEWEKGFINTLIEKPYYPTEKQKDIVKNLIQKYDYLLPPV